MCALCAYVLIWYISVVFYHIQLFNRNWYWHNSIGIITNEGTCMSR